MFLSRVRIRLCEESLQYFDGIIKDDYYTTHQLLWKLFPENPVAKRDYLFRVEQNEGWPLYYVLSKRQPLLTSKIFSVETKTFDPVIEERQKLMFDLRANPVVARKVDGKKNGKHHDVWMDAKHKGKAENYSKEQIEMLAQEYTSKWIVDRSEQCGFSLDKEKLQIISYQQHRAFKKEKHELHYSSVDYRGILTVIDVDKFKYTLYNGVGRAKAFGCGLMLIKPVWITDF